MTSWMDELTETELECMRITLKASVDSDDMGMAVKQHAKILLNEVEDYLWSSVCRNTPASSDQLQAEQK
jgi:hypothetical protein